MTKWPGVGASVATKTLHKKRPALIPILENMAIFGAYMYPAWPEKAALAETIKTVPRIKEALDWIAVDVTRPENETVWAHLHEIEPDRSRIQLFDMVWWMHFPATSRRSRRDRTVTPMSPHRDRPKRRRATEDLVPNDDVEKPN